MTGKDIQNAAFEKAGMRGYRADQVDAYLHTVAEYVDEQNEKIEDLTYKLKVLADKVEEYRTDEENIREGAARRTKAWLLDCKRSKGESEGYYRGVAGGC